MDHNCVQEDKITKIEQDIRDILIQNARSDTNYKNILLMLAEIKSDLCALKERPAKRWDVLIAAVISTIVSFIFNLIK